jgi:hypothetical protein
VRQRRGGSRHSSRGGACQLLASPIKLLCQAWSTGHPLFHPLSPYSGTGSRTRTSHRGRTCGRRCGCPSRPSRCTPCFRRLRSGSSATATRCATAAWTLWAGPCTLYTSSCTWPPWRCGPPLRSRGVKSGWRACCEPASVHRATPTRQHLGHYLPYGMIHRVGTAAQLPGVVRVIASGVKRRDGGAGHSSACIGCIASCTRCA